MDFSVCTLIVYIITEVSFGYKNVKQYYALKSTIDLLGLDLLEGLPFAHLGDFGIRTSAVRTVISQLAVKVTFMSTF